MENELTTTSCGGASTSSLSPIMNLPPEIWTISDAFVPVRFDAATLSEEMDVAWEVSLEVFRSHPMSNTTSSAEPMTGKIFMERSKIQVRQRPLNSLPKSHSHRDF